MRTDLPEDLLLALVRAVDDASDRWFLTHWEGLERATAERVLDGVVDALRRLLTPAPRGGHGGEAQP